MYTTTVTPDLVREIKRYTGKTVMTYGEALDAIFSTYPINPEFDYVGSWMVHTPDFNVSVGERKDLPSDKAFCVCCDKAFERVFAILEERIKKADAISWDGTLGTTPKLHNIFHKKNCRTVLPEITGSCLWEFSRDTIRKNTLIRLLCYDHTKRIRCRKIFETSRGTPVSCYQ